MSFFGRNVQERKEQEQKQSQTHKHTHTHAHTHRHTDTHTHIRTDTQTHTHTHTYTHINTDPHRHTQTRKKTEEDKIPRPEWSFSSLYASLQFCTLGKKLSYSLSLHQMTKGQFQHSFSTCILKAITLV